MQFNLSCHSPYDPNNLFSYLEQNLGLDSAAGVGARSCCPGWSVDARSAGWGLAVEGRKGARCPTAASRVHRWSVRIYQEFLFRCRCWVSEEFVLLFAIDWKVGLFCPAACTSEWGSWSSCGESLCTVPTSRLEYRAPSAGTECQHALRVVLAYRQISRLAASSLVVRLATCLHYVEWLGPPWKTLCLLWEDAPALREKWEECLYLSLHPSSLIFTQRKNRRALNWFACLTATCPTGCCHWNSSEQSATSPSCPLLRCWLHSSIVVMNDPLCQRWRTSVIFETYFAAASVANWSKMAFQFPATMPSLFISAHHYMFAVSQRRCWTYWWKMTVNDLIATA